MSNHVQGTRYSGKGERGDDSWRERENFEFCLARIGRRGMYGKKKQKGNEGKRICASKEEGGVLLTDESFHLRFSLVALVLKAF